MITSECYNPRDRMVKECVFGRACCMLGVESTKTEDLHG